MAHLRRRSCCAQVCEELCFIGDADTHAPHGAPAATVPLWTRHRNGRTQLTRRLVDQEQLERQLPVPISIQRGSCEEERVLIVFPRDAQLLRELHA
jgi:hypothetical protein